MVKTLPTPAESSHTDGNQQFSIVGVQGTLGTADTTGSAMTVPIGVDPTTGAMYVNNLGAGGTSSSGTNVNIVTGTINTGSVNIVGGSVIGTITAAGSNVSISPNGASMIGVDIGTNTYIGTFEFQATFDGNTWTQIAVNELTTGGQKYLWDVGGGFHGYIPNPSFSSFRVIGTPFTSGSAIVRLITSQGLPLDPQVSQNGDTLNVSQKPRGMLIAGYDSSQGALGFIGVDSTNTAVFTEPLKGTITNIGTNVGMGTLSNVGSINTVTTVSNLTNGTVRVSVGTLTTGTLQNLVTGTINALAAGTITAGTLTNLVSGTVNALASGTVTAGTLTNLVSGTINALAAGTITTGTVSVTTGTMVLNTGTITTIAAGTQNTLGTVGNLNNGSVNLLTGTVTSVTNLAAGTVQINPVPVPATLTFGTLGTAGGSFFGTLSAASGAGTKHYVSGVDIVMQSGTADVRVLAGSLIQGTGVLAAGQFPGGGGISKPIDPAFATGTNSELLYHFVGAGSAFITVSYWKGT